MFVPVLCRLMSDSTSLGVVSLLRDLCSTSQEVHIPRLIDDEDIEAYVQLMNIATIGKRSNRHVQSR